MRGQIREKVIDFVLVGIILIADVAR